jgi:hypothetical protein
MRTSLNGMDGGERVGQPTSNAFDQQFRTDRARSATRNAATAALLLAAVAAASDDALPWPPFLPPPATYAPDLRANVERVWTDPTLRRTVRGRPASVPFDTYVGFVDSPDVTAAAARLLKLARYEVRALGDDWYQADDGDGARGLYRVLARAPTRRVMLSWGEHRSWLLGSIGGSALTVLDLTEHDGRVDQELTAHVRIENALAAALARLLIPIFGHLADRKLIEGFDVAARVAEWAVANPADFCDWLRREPLPPARTELLRLRLRGCR